MSNTHSAEIIPFPGFFRPPAVADLPPTPGVEAADPVLRLQRALAKLQAALDEQREAVAVWRSALVDLNGSVRGLGASLSRYHDTLKTVTPAYRQKG